VKSGVDLVVSKAPNKGAVGLSFSFFDTSVGVINCHMASDSKGQSRVKKRNAEVKGLEFVWGAGGTICSNK